MKTTLEVGFFPAASVRPDLQPWSPSLLVHPLMMVLCYGIIERR